MSSSAFASRVCVSRYAVTTSQTVSFYRGSVAPQNYLGTTTARQWLNDNQHCILNQPIIALTWQYAKGITGKTKLKEYVYTSRTNYNNNNQFVFAEFPIDFSQAPKSRTTMMCRANIMNNSAETVTFYGGRPKTDHKLGTARAWQHISVPAPCFYRKAIYAQVRSVQNNKKVLIHNYKTYLNYTDVNNYNLLTTFPKGFMRTNDEVISLLQTVDG
tara:strand:- start:1398 stop:2042 length:645 start_codon:yes stop_codon:yes gene_type:complete